MGEENLKNLDYFRFKIEKGWAKKNIPNTKEYRDRLEYEIQVISKLGFIDYMLMIADIVEFSHVNNLPVGYGRGSVCGSLIAYAMDITHIDPIKYNLYFERFLNPDRVSQPDVDLDNGTKTRHLVFDYIVRTYGEECVASIATFGKMFAKAIIRNVGMALNMPTGPGSDVDIIAKLFPSMEKDFRECVDASPALQEYEKKYPKLFKYAEALSGKPKSVGVHAAGTVVTPVPIMDLFPMGRGTGDKTSVTQWDMYDVEAAGFVKLDLLGLNTLDIIANTVKLIKENHGVDVDIRNVPTDDPDVIKLFASGKTTGIFQLERKYVQELCKRMDIKDFDDICAINALIRPGTLHSGATELYIKRKTGKEEYKCPHPSLEKCLERTRGILLYQETIMKCVVDYAGFTMPESDTLRKIIGKKQVDKIEKMKEKFYAGAEKLGRPKDVTDFLWEQIDAAKLYSFNASHCYGYGLIAYHTGWLKTHYFKEYMTCLLNGELNSNEPKVDVYLRECRMNKVMILPPDARRGNSNFSIEDGKIRFGLNFIKGVTERCVNELSRLNDKLYSFTDLLMSATGDMNQIAMTNLILAGAFDYLKKDRYFILELYLEIKKRVKLYKEYLKKVDSGVKVKKVLTLEDIYEKEKNFCYVGETMSEQDKLKMEYDLCQCYITNDPMKCFEKYYDEEGFSDIEDLLDEAEYGIKNKQCKILAITRNLMVRAVKNGKNIGRSMASMEIFDTTKECEAVIFPDTFESVKDKVFDNAVYIMRGSYNGNNFIIRDLELIQKNGD